MHFVYILASRPNGALYVGRTADLLGRVRHHRSGRSAHTRRYRITRLVWFEGHEDFATSLARERSIKRWRRPVKNDLVTRTNPDWDDLYLSLTA